MATLTFDGITLNYDPLSVKLYLKENIKSFISPVGDSKTQALGRDARVMSIEGKYAVSDSVKLYKKLRDYVGKTPADLNCELDCFKAILTELVLTGDSDGFGRVLGCTFTEAL